MEILKHIPIYVFCIFFGLIYLGISQMKTKTKLFKKTIILPIVMFIFALFGVYDLGISIYSLFLFFGIIGGLFLGKLFWKKENFIYTKENDTFKILGSKIPFFLIMLIFFTKFIVGMTQARNPEMLENIFIFCGIIILYGIFSGIFLHRLQLLVNLRK